MDQFCTAFWEEDFKDNLQLYQVHTDRGKISEYNGGWIYIVLIFLKVTSDIFFLSVVNLPENCEMILGIESQENETTQHKYSAVPNTGGSWVAGIQTVRLNFWFHG